MANLLLILIGISFVLWIWLLIKICNICSQRKYESLILEDILYDLKSLKNSVTNNTDKY